MKFVTKGTTSLQRFSSEWIRRRFLPNKIFPECLSIVCRHASTTHLRPHKVSYLAIPGQKPLLGMTMGQLANQAAEKFGDAEGFVMINPNMTRKTFAQINMESDRLAAGLLNLGLNKGERVGIWGPNSYEWYLTQLGVMKAGMILVNINPAYQPRELSYCLNKVGIKCVVFAEPFKTQNYYDMLTQVVPEIKSADPGKIQSSSAPSLTHLISINPSTNSQELKTTYSFEEILHRGSKSDNLNTYEKQVGNIQFDDVCNIQFTSGTTGNPKGVMLSHHNIVNNGYCIGRRLFLSEKDKICVPVPLFHCYGGVAGQINALHYGATCVFPSPGFDPKAAIDSVQSERCTVMYGTPTMHIDMLHIPGFETKDVSSLRIAVTAGSICPEELIKEMKRKYTVDSVVSFYGLTETSPVFFQSLPDDTDTQRSVTVGYPSEHVEVKLIDGDGHIVPIGTEGELCARGYVTMQGYWDEPEKTREVLKSSKWFHSGDLGIMYDTGHARIVGRLKDMIIRGGENIYPREIEDFLHTHPKIQEAHVFGIPDERLGEQVAVWISLKSGQTLSIDELKAFCKGQISHYKVPYFIHFTDQFPKTTSGKIQKFRMREVTLENLLARDDKAASAAN